MSINLLSFILPFESNLSESSGLLERKNPSDKVDKIFHAYVVSLASILILVSIIYFIIISTKKPQKIDSI